MKTENKYRLGLFLMGVALVCVLLPKGCISIFNKSDKQNTLSIKVDTITPKIKKNKSDIIALVDSSKIFKEQLKQANKSVKYFKIKYKSTHDSLYSLSDSIGKIRLVIVNQIKQKQDSSHEAENQANLLLVINAYNQIGEYQDNEVLYVEKIKRDSTEKKQLNNRIVHLIDTLPKVKRKGFLKGFKWGFTSGVILTEGG